MVTDWITLLSSSSTQLVSRIGHDVVVEVVVVVAKMNFRILVPNVHESVNGQVWLEPTYLCIRLGEWKVHMTQKQYLE